MEKDYLKYCIDVSSTVLQAIKALDITHKKLIVIVDHGILQGVVTDGDIRRFIISKGDLSLPIRSVMCKEPVYLYEREAGKAQQKMNEFLIDGIPIVDKRLKVVNIVFRYDVLTECSNKNEQLNIPVVIMAGGKGTRLLPYTGILPKPLMLYKNKTIIEYILDSFAKYGCSQFYFTMNYKKEIIKAYLNEMELPYQLHFIDEENFLGTGGSLYYLKNKIETTFFVSNCDTLLEIDYAAALSHHKSCRNAITIMAAHKGYGIPYGVIQTKPDGSVTALEEKPQIDFLVNTGVYILEPEVFQVMKEKKFIHMTEVIELALESGKRVGSYSMHESCWTDMGELEELLVKNKN